MSISLTAAHGNRVAVPKLPRTAVIGGSVLGGLLRHRLAVMGLAALALVATTAVLAPVIAPHDPYQQHLYEVLQNPSRTHLLGTDHLGRDLLSRVLYGARVSLFVGAVATLAASFIGVMVGLAAGYLGGAIDTLLMRIADAFQCLPFFVFVLAIAAALGPGLSNVIIAVIVLGWTGFARIIRGQVLLVRDLPYIEAARAAGGSTAWIVVRHVLPNTIAPIIVAASIAMGTTILTESAVAFLGLGAQPPTASWGRELRTGFTYLERGPLLSVVPGLMIMATVLALNFVGDGLRDALDPKLRGGL